MRVFVTVSTGFIGSAVVKELIGAGHQVSGLTRSKEGAKKLTDLGATPHWGSLENLESLKKGAATADGVIHLAFIHGFSDAKLSNRLGVLGRALLGQGLFSSFLSLMINTDMAAINAMGTVLAGSGRPFLITVGTMGMRSGTIASETDPPSADAPGAARSLSSEKAAADWAAKGVQTSVIRLPPSVHGEGDKGLVPRLIATAKKSRVSAYVGSGDNRWPAVHRVDAARLYRLALENGTASGVYHGVAETGIPFREIAEVIGRRLGLPVASKPPGAAPAHFSFLAPFVGADNPVSSQATREKLDWDPAGPGLMADIDRPNYYEKEGKGYF